MNIPSKKTIQKYLEWLDDDQVNKVRGLMEGVLDPEEVSEATAKWVRSCYNEPSDSEKIMSAINDVIECHGVESLSSNGDVVATYCNTGDTYKPTVMYLEKECRFRIMSWGDYAEKHPVD
jgi:hypothetical protein